MYLHCRVPLETQQSSHPEANDVYKKPRRKKKRRRPKPEVIEKYFFVKISNISWFKVKKIVFLFK